MAAKTFTIDDYGTLIPFDENGRELTDEEKKTCSLYQAAKIIHDIHIKQSELRDLYVRAGLRETYEEVYGDRLPFEEFLELPKKKNEKPILPKTKTYIFTLTGEREDTPEKIPTLINKITKKQKELSDAEKEKTKIIKSLTGKNNAGLAYQDSKKIKKQCVNEYEEKKIKKPDLKKSDFARSFAKKHNLKPNKAIEWLKPEKHQKK